MDINKAGEPAQALLLMYTWAIRIQIMTPLSLHC